MIPSILAAHTTLQSIRNSLFRSAVVPRLRTFASVLPAVPPTDDNAIAESSKKASDARKPGALRPHLGIDVDPNHGLYAFFRKSEKDGEVRYDTLLPMEMTSNKSGRAWLASELRRKSFKDLHTLWYVLLRERNLLATQEAEARRIGAPTMATDIDSKPFRVRKSMARIKYVINERRLAYEGAVKIFQDKVQKRLARREQKRQEHKRYLAGLEKQREEKEREKALAAAKAAVPEGDAANLAVAGLFQAAPSGSADSSTITDTPES